jgi:small-conductance mechanosensitive channel
MLFNVFIFTDISDTAKQFQRLIILIPIFRIFQKLMDRSLLKYLYIFFGLFALSIVEKNANGFGLDARLFSIGLSLALAIFSMALIRNRVFDNITNKTFIIKNIYKLLGLCIALLTVSMGADMYGATLLATYITNGIFVSLYASIVFYTLTVILAGYTIILLRRRMATASFMVEKYASDVEKAITIFIKLFMTLWWMLIVLKTIGIYPHIVDAKNKIMELSWMVGSSTISIESIFNFFSIIIITWFIAKLIRMILEVEIFSRFKLPRGFPTAITTVLNYIIVIGGTFIAFSSLGITTEQFTLVFGALGVGIGFGIRNIIANFISGIIMVFERPVQIGDTIEINNSMGTVQDIGTRSSTIKTFDGSEVIIPNADFIAKEITNWTLSDERRRKTIVFKVALDSNIEEVLEIMQRVSSSHIDTLKDPKPVATLLNFSEYYLEFKLYFWLNSNLIVAPSDITINIYKALKEANIKMPLPKQEFLKGTKF